MLTGEELEQAIQDKMCCHNANCDDCPFGIKANHSWDGCYDTLCITDYPNILEALTGVINDLADRS